MTAEPYAGQAHPMSDDENKRGMHPAGQRLLTEVRALQESMGQDIDTDELHERYARNFFHNDATPAAEAMLAQGAACPACSQSGPSKPGSDPCPLCDRNTAHKA